MNRIYIEAHNIDVDVREVNLAGVKLARSAIREGQYVLGDVSSTGKMLETRLMGLLLAVIAVQFMVSGFQQIRGIP